MILTYHFHLFVFSVSFNSVNNESLYSSLEGFAAKTYEAVLTKFLRRVIKVSSFSCPVLNFWFSEEHDWGSLTGLCCPRYD